MSRRLQELRSQLYEKAARTSTHRNPPPPPSDTSKKDPVDLPGILLCTPACLAFFPPPPPPPPDAVKEASTICTSSVVPSCDGCLTAFADAAALLCRRALGFFVAFGCGVTLVGIYRGGERAAHHAENSRLPTLRVQVDDFKCQGAAEGSTDKDCEMTCRGCFKKNSIDRTRPIAWQGGVQRCQSVAASHR